MRGRFCLAEPMFRESLQTGRAKSCFYARGYDIISLFSLRHGAERQKRKGGQAYAKQGRRLRRVSAKRKAQPSGKSTGQRRGAPGHAGQPACPASTAAWYKAFCRTQECLPRTLCAALCRCGRRVAEPPAAAPHGSAACGRSFPAGHACRSTQSTPGTARAPAFDPDRDGTVHPDRIGRDHGVPAR